MDHQVSPEPENSQSEAVDGEEDGGSDQENEPNGNAGKAGKAGAARGRLFSFSMVNSYGTANISPLPCDGNILKLTSEYAGGCEDPTEGLIRLPEGLRRLCSSFWILFV